MSEETKDETKQPSPEEAMQAIQSSIANAFNLGLQQQPKPGADTSGKLKKKKNMLMSKMQGCTNQA